VRTIAVIALAVGGTFFGLMLLIGDDVTDGFVFAIGVTVALVAEALLPTVTLSLAWGAEQMAKRNVLVRSLEAVETLGSTTFICTNKTGTLTRNQMAVVEAWTPEGVALIDGVGYGPTGSMVLSTPEAKRGLERLALAGARCSAGYAFLADGEWRAHGDPMEAALDMLARRIGVDVKRDRSERPDRARFPFDPRTRRMSVVVDGEVLFKGAPDSVLPRCDDGDTATEVLEVLAAKGLRVLAVAGRSLGEAVPASAEEAATGLTPYGLVLHDVRCRRFE
jgi:magnesium-transporting ATPase (P-type)